MRKKIKHKPQIIGINPEWVKIYIIKPLSIICVAVAIFVLAINRYNAYATEKAERESLEAIEREKQKAEEDKRLESIRELEELRAEEERRKESLAQIEIETRRTNTLYENTISKRVLPVGTYLKNNELKKVGRVTEYYGLDVITNNGWSTTLDENGQINSNIQIIGYYEYMRELKKQKEHEEKKKQIENANKTNQLYEEARAEQKKEVQKYYGRDVKYLRFMFEGKKYRVKNLDGRQFRLIEKYSKETILVDAYDTRLIEIDIKEYERGN